MADEFEADDRFCLLRGEESASLGFFFSAGDAEMDAELVLVGPVVPVPEDWMVRPQFPPPPPMEDPCWEEVSMEMGVLILMVLVGSTRVWMAISSTREDFLESLEGVSYSLFLLLFMRGPFACLGIFSLYEEERSPPEDDDEDLGGLVVLAVGETLLRFCSRLMMMDARFCSSFYPQTSQPNSYKLLDNKIIVSIYY